MAEDIKYGFFSNQTRQSRTALVISSTTLFLYTLFAKPLDTAVLISAQTDIPGGLFFWCLLFFAALYFWISFFLSAKTEYGRYKYVDATKDLQESLQGTLQTFDDSVGILLNAANIAKSSMAKLTEQRSKLPEGGMEQLLEDSKSFNNKLTINTVKEIATLLDLWSDHERQIVGNLDSLGPHSKDATAVLTHGVSLLRDSNEKHKKLEGRRLRLWDYWGTAGYGAALILVSILAECKGWNFYCSLVESCDALT
ncbi:hypothetical protein ACFOOP_14185 [Marinicaulis aureus]|uniref:Uncharacterized protein n=1 Tax=Hyphococcus aureus TaxID=2666033 RepID=A0ABW1L2E0_9PROT